MGANVKLANAMGVAGKTMSDMNKILKPEQIATTVGAFGKESMKMDMTEEMSNNCFYFLALKNSTDVIVIFFF